jgi:hypothetical protein
MSAIPVPIPNAQIDRWTKAAYGSWGEFSTAGGKVLYLSAHVNLHGDAQNGGNSLVESIAPVREILDTTKLSFAELLQRDLEDHRVLSGLIPYLLDDNHDTIGFFPPLLAVLLPFDSNVPTAFNEGSEKYRQADSGLWTKDIVCPEYFRFSRTTYGENGDLVRTQRTGELEWNSDKTKLVVIDGQHRAMALLAIYRSLADGDKWSGTGAKYKHFYNDEIKRRWGDGGLPNLEVPVSICIFPELLGINKGEEVHRAARKLFVDVNKEAKTPNQSRLILLSESNLSDIFTRSWLDELRSLNQARSSHTALPLCAIEYDTPSSHRSGGNDRRPQRKICIATVQQLKFVIEQVVRGSEEWVTNIVRTNKAKLSGSDAFMIRQLGLDDGNENKLIVDGQPVMKLSDLSRENFPTEAVDSLRVRFLTRWGRPLIRVFSELEPYQTVAHSIKHFESNWAVSPDQEMALAKEALFEGVGTYWTLEEFHNDWKENHPKNKPAAAEAWEIVEQKAKEFERLRSEFLSGSSNPTEQELTAARALSDRLITQALLSGIGMGFATLVMDFKISSSKRDEFTEAFVYRLNEFFRSTSATGRNRMFYFGSLQPDGASNSSFYAFVKNLEPVRWVHMRWLVLEAFFSSPFPWSAEILELIPEQRLEAIKKRRTSELRTAYIETVVQEHLDKELKKDRLPADEVKVRIRVLKEMEARYLDWFEESIDLTTSIQNSSLTLSSQIIEDDDEDENDLIFEGDE